MPAECYVVRNGGGIVRFQVPVTAGVQAISDEMIDYLAELATVELNARTATRPSTDWQDLALEAATVTDEDFHHGRRLRLPDGQHWTLAVEDDEDADVEA